MNYYNRTNTCDKCREENIITKLVSGKVHREQDKEGNWTGRWLCHICYMKDWNKDTWKILSNRRTNNQNQNSPRAKGDKAEELTVRWLCIDNLNIKNDNYNSPIDHSKDIMGLVYQTKSKRYDPINRCWKQTWQNEHCKEFDFLIFYCISRDGKIIERIYIFPKEDVESRSSIGIIKNPSKGRLWYEKYRVNDDNILKNVNELWKEIG